VSVGSTGCVDLERNDLFAVMVEAAGAIEFD
jgi:hypothetical protein